MAGRLCTAADARSPQLRNYTPFKVSAQPKKALIIACTNIITLELPMSASLAHTAHRGFPVAFMGIPWCRVCWCHLWTHLYIIVNTLFNGKWNYHFLHKPYRFLSNWLHYRYINGKLIISLHMMQRLLTKGVKETDDWAAYDEEAKFAQEWHYDRAKIEDTKCLNPSTCTLKEQDKWCSNSYSRNQVNPHYFFFLSRG